LSRGRGSERTYIAERADTAQASDLSSSSSPSGAGSLGLIVNLELAGALFAITRDIGKGK
jgi:hypothetical protein